MEGYIKKIDLDSKVDLFSLSDFKKKILKPENETYIKLNEVELCNVVSVITLQLINEEYVVDKQTEDLLFDRIICGEHEFFNDNRSYIIKLISELDRISIRYVAFFGNGFYTVLPICKIKKRACLP